MKYSFFISRLRVQAGFFWGFASYKRIQSRTDKNGNVESVGVGFPGVCLVDTIKIAHFWWKCRDEKGIARGAKEKASAGVEFLQMRLETVDFATLY